MYSSITFSSENDLLVHSKSLKGITVFDLLQGNPLGGGKGAIGQAIERCGFGVANNNESRPDFHELGIELKILPLKRSSKNNLIVKERTKVCSINYMKLIDEKWISSNARHKLEKILFVFYEYDKDDHTNSRIANHFLFCLENSEEPLIRSDWERTRELVNKGEAHLLSESQNVILAASRAGAGGLDQSKWDEQPNKKYEERARKRAFSLKPSFTKTLWLEINSKAGLGKIIDKFKYKNYEDLENYILKQLNQWTNHSLKEFAITHKSKMLTSKNAHANIIRTALGFKDKEQIKEILQLGLLVKIASCRPNDMYPWESMSFPHQPLGDLAEEDRFDESDFYSMLQGFIIIPLLRSEKAEKDFKKINFGESIIWRPNKEQLLIIQKEWEYARDIVRKGIKVSRKKFNNKKGYVQLNNLPKESETQIIHMRPHGRNSDDIDKSLKNTKITKQCFWFNKSFIQSLLKK